MSMDLRRIGNSTARAALLRTLGTLIGALFLWVGASSVSLAGLFLMLIGVVAIVAALTTPRAPLQNPAVLEKPTPI